jgi:hypothetical protein
MPVQLAYQCGRGLRPIHELVCSSMHERLDKFDNGVTIFSAGLWAPAPPFPLRHGLSWWAPTRVPTYSLCCVGASNGHA